MSTPSIDSETVKIRPAGSGDVEAIQMLAKFTEFPCTVGQVAERLERIAGEDRNAVLVAEIDDRVVAFVHLYVRHNVVAGVAAEFSELAIDKEYHSTEVPWVMIDEIEKWGRSKGCDYVCAKVDVFNRPSHTLLEKSGYHFFHTQMGFRKAL